MNEKHFELVTQHNHLVEQVQKVEGEIRRLEAEPKDWEIGQDLAYAPRALRPLQISQLKLWSSFKLYFFSFELHFFFSCVFIFVWTTVCFRTWYLVMNVEFQLWYFLKKKVYFYYLFSWFIFDSLKKMF